MVALLHPTRPALAPLEAVHPRAARRQAPRHLRLVQTQARSSIDSLSVIAVAAVMATILLVVLVRGVQGAPPAADWNGLADAATPAAAAQSSATVTVVEGDTWATLAARVAPGTDPVEFARSLASANGGYQLQVGQVLVLTAAD